MLANLPPAALKQLFESLGGYAFAVDVLPTGQMRYSAFSSRLERAVGCNIPIEGKAPGEFLSAAAAAHVEANYRRCIAARTLIEYDEDVDLPGGRRSWHTVLAPQFDEAARVVRIIGTTTDMTERKLLEEERDRFFAVSHDVLAIVAPEGRFKRVSASFARLLGFSETELLTTPILDLVHSDDHEHTVRSLRQLWEDGVPTIGCENRYRRKAGGHVWLSWNGIRSNGLMFCIARDVTDQHRMTAELRQAKQEAERASTMKSRFLAAASHDLRQPLQAGMIFYDIVAKRNRDGALAGIVGKLGQSLDALRDMLDALLDLSKLDAGSVTADKSRFPLGGLIARLADDYGPLAQASAIGFKTRCKDADIHSDPRLLERILRNLLCNALRYTNPGGRVLLACRRAGDHVRIQVWDTGIGIPEDKLTAIFEEFRQLDGGGAGYHRGLGLGLSIVERLAKVVDHPIHVRSCVGKGSMFEVRVPLAGRYEPEQRRARSDRTVDGGLIVLIDDDLNVTEAMRILLEAAGHAVIAAADASEALPLIRAQPRAPDVILADYRLRAGETGIDAIRCLWDRLGYVTPGILLTGDTSPERLREAAATGFDLVHKPIQPDELLRLFNRFL